MLDACLDNRLVQTTCLIFGIIIGGALMHFRSYQTQQNKKKLHKSISNGCLSTYEHFDKAHFEIIQEQFSRNFLFFGNDGQNYIFKSFVIIVGCGGVGSHCAITLARSGVGRLRIIDFDRVTLSSLNRHAAAKRDSVGLSKVECLKQSIHEICPETQVETFEAFFDHSVASQLLSDHPDYVVDCIDNLQSKVDLIHYCHEQSLPLIVACGAGAKADASCVRIGDISCSFEDPLSRAVRKKLRERGISKGINICYSTERTNRALAPLDEHQIEQREDYKLLPTLRLRLIPVIATVPAVMGQAMASHVLCNLAKQPISNELILNSKIESPQLKVKSYLRCFEVLKQAWKSNIVNPKELSLTFGETQYLVRDFYKYKSIVSDVCCKQSIVQLVPWYFSETNRTSSIRISNMILCNRIEASQHLKLGGCEEMNQALYGEKICKKVTEGLKELEDIML